MKTVGKKLLSLLLVAMLLVSAVPFGALAADGYKVEFKIHVNESYRKSFFVEAFSEAEMMEWANFDADDLMEFLDEEGQLDGLGDITDYDVIPYSVLGDTLPIGVWLTVAGEEEEEDDVIVETPGADEEEEEEDDAIVVIPGGNEEEDEEDDVVVETPGADEEGEEEDDAVVETPGADEEEEEEDEPVVTPGNNNGLLEAPDLYIVVKTGSGDYRIKVSFGDKYLDALSPPARPDREFKGWYSSVLGRMVKTSDIVEEDDTVEAVWSTPIKHTLTFIDERGTEPDVEYFKQIAYGSKLGTLPTPADRDGYIFVGWKLDATGKYITANTVYEWQGDVTAYAQWKLESDTEGEPMGGTNQQDGKVYLEIYINGDTDTLKKRVDITSYAADNKITRAEAQAVVAKYITAKAGYTLAYEGLFDDPLWWEYKHDPETNGKESVVVNRDGDDYVFVMVKNVKVVTGDPSNPKTGDYVLTAAMTMMAVSGMAAAAVYVIGKKRRA